MANLMNEFPDIEIKQDEPLMTGWLFPKRLTR